MKLIDSLRSRLSGQTRDEFGLGQKFPLPKSMIATVKQHSPRLRSTDLSAYTFERRPSKYFDTKSDLVIYDEGGQAILHGREGSNGKLTIWED